ncbi:MAG: hypothetical protein QXE90_00535 [Candidatus Micrarchaeia archaeon]
MKKIEEMYMGEGGSLFDSVDLSIVKADSEEIKMIRKKLEKTLERYKKTSDDRALALVCALAIENELDEVLKAWIPTYKILMEEKGFDFSSKINLAKALKLIPGKIVNGIEPIKKIRNIFAHNLDIETFKMIKEVDEEVIVSLNNKLKTFIPDWKEDNPRLAIFELTVIIVLGLNLYSKKIELLNKYIRTRENLDKIMDEAMRKN